MDFDYKWDMRFLDLAHTVACWSKDPSTKVGSVIVRPDKTVAALGFNGFPRLMPDLPEYLENREEKYSRVIHAEMNALLQAREPVQGYIMYCSLLPCDRCLVHAAQAGIVRFIAPIETLQASARWGAAFDKTRSYARQMGLELVQYQYPKPSDIQVVTGDFA